MTTDPIGPNEPFATAKAGVWRLDPARSSVEFHVRHFYGLTTVHGRFGSYEGVLDLRGEPWVELTIDAASLDTKHPKRDAHLRSDEFFDVEHHPQVRFVSETAVLGDDTLRVRGRLHAAGQHVPVEVDATLRAVGDELEADASTEVDHRELGMTWSPLGTLRPPSRLTVRGRLVRDETTAER
jgi:polyisoprenoid-binding protein YceI